MPLAPLPMALMAEGKNKRPPIKVECLFIVTTVLYHAIRVWYWYIRAHHTRIVCCTIRVYVTIATNMLLGEPHTSGKNGTSEGTSVAFAKVYVEIRINGKSVMRSQKFYN